MTKDLFGADDAPTVAKDVAPLRSPGTGSKGPATATLEQLRRRYSTTPAFEYPPAADPSRIEIHAPSRTEHWVRTSKGQYELAERAP